MELIWYELVDGCTGLESVYNSASRSRFALVNGPRGKTLRCVCTRSCGRLRFLLDFECDEFALNKKKKSLITKVLTFAYRAPRGVREMSTCLYDIIITENRTAALI